MVGLTLAEQGLTADLEVAGSFVKTPVFPFVRFPGGCFIEGHTLGQRWNWKDSLGPIEERRGMARSFWGYSIWKLCRRDWKESSI